MAAGKLNLSGDRAIEQGATYDVTITWYDTYVGEGDPGNVVHDVSGYTARMHIRDPDILATGAADLVLELTTANGRIVLGGALGTIQLLIDAVTTAGLDPAVKSKYDLEMVNGAVVTRLVEGSVTVKKEQTV